MASQSLWQKLFRIKDRSDVPMVLPDPTKAISIYDLVNCGVNAVLGIGIYIVLGQVIKDLTGPSIIISLVIGATACILSGICYAELCARSPDKKGSAYTYMYHTSGELLAFTCAWCLILQHILIVALCSKSISQNFDFLIGNRILNFTAHNIGQISTFNSYPDFLAFIIVLSCGTLVIIGLKLQSTTYKVASNGITLLLVLFVTVVGMFKVHFQNWTTGNVFFPHQLGGVFTGASLCFVIFNGLDPLLAITENVPSHSNSMQYAKNSIYVILISILATVFICLVSYLGISSVFTLIINTLSLQTESPFEEGLSLAKIDWVRYIVFIGLIVAVLPLIFNSFIQVGQVVQSMSADGLLYPFFGEVSERIQLPLVAVVAHSIFAAICSTIFNMLDTICIVSVCMLVVHLLACISVVCVRYQPRQAIAKSPKRKRSHKRKMKRDKHLHSILKQDIDVIQTSVATNINNNSKQTDPDHKTKEEIPDGEITCAINYQGDAFQGNSDHQNDLYSDSSDTDIDEVVDEYKEMLRVATLSTDYENASKIPTSGSGKRASWGTCSMVIWMIALSAVLIFGHKSILVGNAAMIVLICVFILLILFSIFIIVRQPQEEWGLSELQFSVPFVPWLPAIAMLLTSHLLLRLPLRPFIAFSVWVSGGLVFYVLYGIRHTKHTSSYGPLMDEERVLLGPLYRESMLSDAASAQPISQQSSKRLQEVDTVIIG